MTGCCRGLPAKDCIARPYGCADDPAEELRLKEKYEGSPPENCTGWCGGIDYGKVQPCPYKHCKHKT